jgi:hypothetical protein
MYVPNQVRSIFDLFHSVSSPMFFRSIVVHEHNRPVPLWIGAGIDFKEHGKCHILSVADHGRFLERWVARDSCKHFVFCAFGFRPKDESLGKLVAHAKGPLEAGPKSLHQ